MQTQPQARLRAVLEAGQKRHARAFNKQQPPSATTGVHTHTSNVPVVHAELLLGDVDQYEKPFFLNEEDPRSMEYTMSQQYPDGRPMLSHAELTKVVEGLIDMAEREKKVIAVNYSKMPNKSDLHEVYNPKEDTNLEYRKLYDLIREMLEKEWEAPRGPIVYLK